MAVLLRTDFDASRAAKFGEENEGWPQARRLLALAAIYDGAKRTSVTKRELYGFISQPVLHGKKQLRQNGAVQTLA